MKRAARAKTKNQVGFENRKAAIRVRKDQAIWKNELGNRGRVVAIFLEKKNGVWGFGRQPGKNQVPEKEQHPVPDAVQNQQKNVQAPGAKKHPETNSFRAS